MTDWGQLVEENSKDVGVLRSMNYGFCGFKNECV